MVCVFFDICLNNNLQQQQQQQPAIIQIHRKVIMKSIRMVLRYLTKHQNIASELV